MKRTKRTLTAAAALLGATLALLPVDGLAKRTQTSKAGNAADWLQEKVRHELVMLPYYSVFDHITYKIEGDRVELAGQVYRPTLRSSAARVVQQIEGVSSVTNNIEVLPASPNDDRIRLAVYRAIYGSSALSRYRLQPIPSIHIIVKNGQVALEGVAATEMDRNIANIKANGVPGVFSVAQNLVVEKK
ncbi:MAG: BON domain-containing protein [Acidimicrobiia bacterium]|nr:BON domain-containing protein [Acidimicrobiia bacterium]